MAEQNVVTTFPKLKKIVCSPQGIKQLTGYRTKHTGLHPVQAALLTVKRDYTVSMADSRQKAIEASKAVIVIGKYAGPFHGKPVLHVRGRLTPNLQSTNIRSFLKEHGVSSVAVVAEDGQAFWSFYRVFRKVLRWDLPDRKFLADDVKDEIRRLYATGKYTQGELATRFSVSQPAIVGTVTGHADREYFRKLRSDGYVTLNELATETGAYWTDVNKKCADLGITPRVTGPRTIMVRGKDKQRLKRAMIAAVAAREQKRENIALRREKYFKALGIVPVESTVIKTVALDDAVKRLSFKHNPWTKEEARDALLASVGLDNSYVL